jgi:hypothetical protein
MVDSDTVKYTPDESLDADQVNVRIVNRWSSISQSKMMKNRAVNFVFQFTSPLNKFQ